MIYELLEKTELHNRFVFLARELSCRFPDLDLRFNRRDGSEHIRFVAKAVSSEIVELDLDSGNPHQLLHSAIFKIKELAQLFDS